MKKVQRQIFRNTKTRLKQNLRNKPKNCCFLCSNSEARKGDKIGAPKLGIGVNNPNNKLGMKNERVAYFVKERKEKKDKRKRRNGSNKYVEGQKKNDNFENIIYTQKKEKFLKF